MGTTESFRESRAGAVGAPPLRVHALGRFAVEVDGRVLGVDDRSVGRPIELLQCLIACGGIQVPESRLAEELWPDADGDRAHRAFSTTLHRLRRLLGPDALALRLGRLSLEPGRCRVDALEFRAGFPSPPEGDVESLQRLLALYQGPFLEGGPDLPPIVAMREQLRALYVQRALSLGRLLRAQGRDDAAAGVYEQALALEPAAESICEALMACQVAAGRPAEAMAIYRRHRRYAAALGAPPAPALERRFRQAAEQGAVDEALPESPSLAVLPFAFLGGARKQRWLAAAFTENLAAHLARLPRLVVTDWHSAHAYAQTGERVRQIGVELGVRYLLRGTVQAAGGRVRVTAMLVDTRSEETVWAEPYDGSLDDGFGVQDRIVTQVLSALEVHLTEGEQARLLWRGTTQNPQAWELAVRGLEHYRRFTPEDHAAARRLWSAALDLDPDYVMALVPLGWTYVSDVRRGRTRRPAQSLARAESLAWRALQVDPHSGPAHVLLGTVRVDQGRHDEGRALLLKAAELNPHGADTAVIVGSGLSYCGEPRDGERWVRRAMRLSPFYPEWYLAPLGCALYLCGDFQGALRALQRSRVVQSAASGMALIAASQMALERPMDARDTVNRLLRTAPSFSVRRRLRRMFPVRDPALRTELAARLRAAGCP